MIDEKPIMDQIHEYENLVADVLSEGMKMCEILQANVLLEKFPPTWSEYRNHLKHKKRDLTLQELIRHMRTEEANRLKDKETSLSSLSIKANLVESAGSKDRFYQNKGKNSKRIIITSRLRQLMVRSKRANNCAIAVGNPNIKHTNATKERINKRQTRNLHSRYSTNQLS
ncbi:UNVERIFIED_CONTAM: hypothetical protein Sangu_1941300 [Sesamum angustifolium]|uniref:Uncharacterized protein n=1 Tax=Sesamum angustifolium TaxID=2727405 RepID=A0AAW2LVP9_9LAMI